MTSRNFRKLNEEKKKKQQNNCRKKNVVFVRLFF